MIEPKPLIVQRSYKDDNLITDEGKSNKERGIDVIVLNAQMKSLQSALDKVQKQIDVLYNKQCDFDAEYCDTDESDELTVAQKQSFAHKWCANTLDIQCKLKELQSEKDDIVNAMSYIEDYCEL